MMGENPSVYEKVNLLEMEDRISDLPDSIIQHILSFLPSIREAVQTCVLSKRWKNQWTSVPVLTFDLSGMSEEYASRFVFNTLTRYECPKVQKFQVVKEGDYGKCYPHIVESISFAVGKHTEVMVLDLFFSEFLLPACVFNQSSLVNLNIFRCGLEPTLKVCWENLKELFLGFCLLSDEMAFHNILCGSPVLESLVIETCFGCGDHLVIESKSLKKLELRFEIYDVLEISCPNLEQLCIVGSFDGRPVKIKNSPSLNHVTLDDVYDVHSSEKLLQQLQHVKSLKFGFRFIKFLSNLEVKAALSLPLLSNKCLALCSLDFGKHSAGIARALHNSHVLEKLVITKVYRGKPDFSVSDENHWSWNNVVFTCLESHLKVVEILGFSKKCPDYKHVLNFIEFILKNAKVLETLVVDFEFQVSLETRCSPHATVRVI